MRSTYRNPQNLHIDPNWLKSELAKISAYEDYNELLQRRFHYDGIAHEDSSAVFFNDARPVMTVKFEDLAFSVVNNIDFYGNQKLLPPPPHEVVPRVWRGQAAQMRNREFGFYLGAIELKKSGLFDAKARIFPYL